MPAHSSLISSTCLLWDMRYRAIASARMPRPSSASAGAGSPLSSSIARARNAFRLFENMRSMNVRPAARDLSSGARAKSCIARVTGPSAYSASQAASVYPSGGGGMISRDRAPTGVLPLRACDARSMSMRLNASGSTYGFAGAFVFLAAGFAFLAAVDMLRCSGVRSYIQAILQLPKMTSLGEATRLTGVVQLISIGILLFVFAQQHGGAAVPLSLASCAAAGVAVRLATFRDGTRSDVHIASALVAPPACALLFGFCVASFGARSHGSLSALSSVALASEAVRATVASFSEAPAPPRPRWRLAASAACSVLLLAFDATAAATSSAAVRGFAAASIVLWVGAAVATATKRNSVAHATTSLLSLTQLSQLGAASALPDALQLSASLVAALSSMALAAI